MILLTFPRFGSHCVTVPVSIVAWPVISSIKNKKIAVTTVNSSVVVFNLNGKGSGESYRQGCDNPIIKTDSYEVRVVGNEIQVRVPTNDEAG